jgi:hypothetical protein
MHVVKEMPTESEDAGVMDAATGHGMLLGMQMRNHEKVALCWGEVTIKAGCSHTSYFTPRNSYQ